MAGRGPLRRKERREHSMSDEDSILATLVRMRLVTEAHQAKKGKWTPEAQFLKIYEEVGEAHYSWKKQNPGWQTVQEVADIILASITQLQVLGCSDGEISWAIEDCLQKCEKRTGLRPT